MYMAFLKLNKLQGYSFIRLLISANFASVAGLTVSVLNNIRDNVV